MVQKTPAPRVGGGPTDRARQQQAWQRQAEYLSTLEPQRRSALALRVPDPRRGRRAARRR